MNGERYYGKAKGDKENRMEEAEANLLITLLFGLKIETLGNC